MTAPGAAVLSLALAAAVAAGAPHGSGASIPGLVLREVVTSGARAEADTLVTVLAAGRVRVSHHGGAAILDVPGDRLLLLDAATRTYRAMSLVEWERELERSPALVGVRPDTLEFEPAGGDEARIAGYACERWHLYARHEVFPGELDGVEEEIWVTRELVLPEGALEGYRRVLASLDRIDLDAVVERPPGVALRTSKLRRPEGKRAASGEIEVSEVIAVERRDVPASWFAIPTGYTRSDSTEAGERP